MRPRRLAGAALPALALLGAVAFRRGSTRHRERVDLYFQDGSMVSLGKRSSPARRMLPLAREILHTARA